MISQPYSCLDADTCCRVCSAEGMNTKHIQQIVKMMIRKINCWIVDTMEFYLMESWTQHKMKIMERMETVEWGCGDRRIHR